MYENADLGYMVCVYVGIYIYIHIWQMYFWEVMQTILP